MKAQFLFKHLFWSTYNSCGRVDTGWSAMCDRLQRRGEYAGMITPTCPSPNLQDHKRDSKVNSIELTVRREFVGTYTPARLTKETMRQMWKNIILLITMALSMWIVLPMQQAYAAGAFVKLQILVPGETAAPGTATGKTGTPTARTSGTAFNVKVNAVDANWNVISTLTDVVGITSTDGNAILPSNAALVSGTMTFSVTLKTAGTPTITATDITNGTKTANTSPSITVNAGSLDNFLVESSAGGDIGAQATGVAFTIKITARDVYNNTAISFTGGVNTANITSTGTLSGGPITTTAFTNGVLASQSVTITNSGSFTITVTKGTPTGTSNSFTVGNRRYAVAKSSWNTTATWSATSGGTSGASVPVDGDIVFIGEAATDRNVTIPSGYSATCASLTMGNLTDNTKAELIFFASSSNLTVSGNLTMNRPNDNATSTITLGAGNLTVKGDLELAHHTASNTDDKRINNITISTGTLTAAGDLIYNGEDTQGKQSSIEFTGAGTLNVAGNFTIINGTLTPSTGTVNFNGTYVAQSIPIGVSAVNYNNLVINNTSAGGATLSNTVTSSEVTGNLSVPSGIFNNGGFAITLASTKQFSVSNGATFNLSGTSSMVTVSRTGSSKTFGATSTVNYAGTTQTVSTENYGNLALSGSGNKTISNGTVVSSNLSISGTAKGLLTNGGTSTAQSITLGGINQASGSWGSSGSAATHKDDIWFVKANTGIINVTSTLCSAYTAVISGTATICNGSSTNLAVTITGGIGPYTVVYSGSTVNGYTSGSAIPVSPSTTTTYTLTSVTDAIGCTATVSGSGVATITITSSGTWLGTTSPGNWSDPSNWCGGVPTASTNVFIPSGTTYQPTVDVTTAICLSLTINASAILTIGAAKALTVSGTLTNNGGTAGLVLQSNGSGTASLIHSTTGVPATVSRYMSGVAESWHFLSSPVAAQAISGDWLPTGTYGNGTGYDLYVWNEPTNCWIYKLNTTAVVNWNTVHSGNNFMVGRGYLYSVQATTPTKVFTGNLNNGAVTYPLTNQGPVTSDNVNGFNLVGNPYPSSIDWQALTGWSRSSLLASGSGYDMWIYNPSAGNYGIFNSASGIGTNSVTQYIAPMQGFFVRAAGAGNLGFSNALKVHTGANDWKSATIHPNQFSVVVQSAVDHTSDEVRLLFGYHENQPGAAKLFSPVAAAPSLYLHAGGLNYTVRYLTDTIENPVVPVLFKPGVNGAYTLQFNFEPTQFETVLLEDLKTQNIQDLKISPAYPFSATVSDAANRFALHFVPIITTSLKELPAKITTHGLHIYVDLTLVTGPTIATVYDLLGRKLYEQQLSGETITTLNFNAGRELLLVKLQNPQGSLCRKLLGTNK